MNYLFTCMDEDVVVVSVVTLLGGITEASRRVQLCTCVHTATPCCILKAIYTCQMNVGGCSLG